LTLERSKTVDEEISAKLIDFLDRSDPKKTNKAFFVWYNPAARDYFFYYSGSTPSAVWYKNWKMYYSMTAFAAAGWVEPLVNFHWTIVANIKRDPFEQAVLWGETQRR
jgi:hypothetical protein